MQAVKVETEPESYVGTSTIVKNIFSLPEDVKIFWAGSRIYAKRLCGKDIVISKTDIFCEGQLEKGDYIRERSISISNRVPPSVKERNLNYRIRSEISLVKPGTRSEEEFFFTESPILLKAGPIKFESPHPVEVVITGIKIRMEKDQFQPGETIKIDYELEKFKGFEVALLKDANVTCNCPEFATTCVHIKPSPPAVEESVKASNLTSGTLQLQLPSFIELTHRYTWEPPERTRWKDTYGDYTNWILEAIGTRTSGEIVKFQIPINIIKKQSPEDVEFFSSKQTKAPVLKKIVVPESFQIEKDAIDENKVNLRLKNTSKETLHGVTVKITPLESEFFELPPNLTGVNEWRPGSEISAYHSKTGKNIKNFQIQIEDNNGNLINKRFNLQ